MDWLDHKYILLCSPYLRNFVKKSPTSYNFSCPHCGDSKKNLRKARGYFYERIFICYNCGITQSLNNFLKDKFPVLYKDIIKEKYFEKTPPQPIEIKEEKNLKIDESGFFALSPIFDLPEIHPAKTYLKNRKIPDTFLKIFRYVDNFNSFTNSLSPNKLPDYDKSNPRIIIPFFSENKELIGYTGRSLFDKEDSLRYITIMLKSGAPKIFGLDRIDKSKIVYITEGPLDSIFIENCVAMAGADLTGTPFKNPVYIFDNEPRNSQVVKRMNKMLDRGHSVFVWPYNWDIFKDINEVITGGQDELMKTIEDNTFHGLAGTIAIMRWQKF